MGRRQGWGRQTVEGSFCFNAVLLCRTGVFDCPFGTEYQYHWQRASGRDCRMNYTVVEMPGVALGLRLNYAVSDRGSTTKHQMQYVVEVTSTRCRFGGRRFWLRCPLPRNGGTCKRRVLRLYLPPGGKMFGCRHCHNLAYQVCQEHDRRIDLLVKNPYLITIALASPDPRLSLLGVKAYVYLLKRLNLASPAARRRRRSSLTAQPPNRSGHL